LAKAPTGSEEAVHAEKSNADPLKKESGDQSHQEKHTHSTGSTSTQNDIPTHSEDSVHADKHEHDPLPDHKKKSSSK
jgi:hypothetical protein